MDQCSWDSGTSLVITIKGTGRRLAESYDAERGGPPLLHVEYRNSDLTKEGDFALKQSQV